MRHLIEDTRDRSNQFAARAVQLAEVVLLIQQLQENAGTPRRNSEQTPLMINRRWSDHDRIEMLSETCRHASKFVFVGAE
jgi:hypothetical protein